MPDTSTQSWKLLYESGREALQARKLQDAEQSFSAALQLAEDFAPSDPRLAATLNALARIYSLQRRYLAAAALLNRLLEVTERTLGPTHAQVAGVLSNLAEMYTHLGAAREELELRERVLAIRGDDPTADAALLQRLRDRVAELRSTLAAEEPAPDPLDDELSSLPVVRTAEYDVPHAAEPAAIEPEADVAPVVAAAVDAPPEPATPKVITPVVVVSAPFPVIAREPAKPMSRPSDAWSESPVAPALEIVSVSDAPMRQLVGTMDHGFSDMGRDEVVASGNRRNSGRSTLYSIAAGVILVAGLIAARSFVAGSDDERVSAGSVSLANAAQPAPVSPTPAASASEERTVEHLVADRETAQSARQERPAVDGESAETRPERLPRVPSAFELARPLRAVDVAVKSVDQRTKTAADSATALRLQDPTFKKSKLADP